MIYLVQYNDRYGNGDDTSIEGYVTSKEDFKRWLKEHNEEREADGECEEDEDEFDLIQLTKL